jgi:peptide deformylase
MSVLKIELLGSEVLRRRAEEIVEVDDDLRRLIRDMFETMYHAEGVGLAGPQIGIERRVIVVDVREEGSNPFALINPRIVESTREMDKAEEGCLSIPGVAGVVERSARVVVEALSEMGEPVRIEAEGMLSRCLQHEVDHLDGVLFIDRLSPLKRNMVLKRYRTLQAGEEKGSERRSSAPARTRG